MLLQPNLLQWPLNIEVKDLIHCPGIKVDQKKIGRSSKVKPS